MTDPHPEDSAGVKRLLPPGLAGGMNGAISAHSSSVRSLSYRKPLRS